MSLLCEKYVREVYDSQGKLTDYDIKVDGTFNFGFDVVDKLAEEQPNKRAMLWISKDNEVKEISFLEMKEKSNQCANFLKSLGIKKGDKVMLVLKRHYEWWYLIVALHKIGAVCIPATNQLMAKDFVYRFNSAGVKAIVCTAEGEVADAVDEAQKKSPTLEYKILSRGTKEGWIPFFEEMEKFPSTFARPSGDEEVKNEDPILMYFTSGTTGFPKMVQHNALYPLGHIFTARHWHNVQQDGLHLTVAETGWGKAVWGKLYGQWLCEAAVMVYDFDRFDAHDLLKAVSDYKVTTFCAPPTIYRFMIQEDLSHYDLSSLRYATIAGEALNPEVYEKFYAATGIKLMEAFGQTETTVVVVTSKYMDPKPGSMGKPSPQFDVCIADENGKEINTGEIGEICIRTAEKTPVGLFMGYYLNDELTKKAWHDGLYHTGDLAWKDEDGYLWYVGRDDDIIKSSGYRIGPFEVESVLMEHPSVVECAITAAPDPVRGQVVKATIVLAKGYEPSDTLKKELQNYVKHATAPYKYPRIVDFVEELPKTISGKIRRVEIRGESK